jgi:Family of unknown function (DUF5996)
MSDLPASWLDEPWEPLPFEEWKDTCATIHMVSQIVGKIRLALAPRLNHWWEVALYVDARGLTTSAIPFRRGIFEIHFDFIDHVLLLASSQGGRCLVPLTARPVADYYRELMSAVASLGVDVKIGPIPSEVQRPIRLDQDREHASYDQTQAHRFWSVLARIDTVLEEFRARFIGKCSPVHFFWGSFDLCVTRFSGRRAPERPGADPITREGYSHEVSSAGFWPGGEGQDAAFYAYAAPEPAGFSAARILPAGAFYHSGMKEFLLGYEQVRKAPSPRRVLLDFLQSSYEAGAELAHWDRANLERNEAST